MDGLMDRWMHGCVMDEGMHMMEKDEISEWRKDWIHEQMDLIWGWIDACVYGWI